MTASGPTLKVRRHFVEAEYAETIDAFYVEEEEANNNVKATM